MRILFYSSIATQSDKSEKKLQTDLTFDSGKRLRAELNYLLFMIR